MFRHSLRRTHQLARSVLNLDKTLSVNRFSTSKVNTSSKDGETDEPQEPWIPEQFDPKNFHESHEDKRARLMYQSRKRGILENGLLLGTFAKKYLHEMTEEEMVLYDRLINLPSNDWEIYYWATGAKETPDEFDNIIMDKLKEHARNENRESRITMPPLN